MFGLHIASQEGFSTNMALLKNKDENLFNGYSF
jgi:hypothetical protein